jgi:hypothetical protein
MSTAQRDQMNHTFVFIIDEGVQLALSAEEGLSHELQGQVWIR